MKIRKYETKDNGERQQFDTGAVREGQTDKLRYDLIPTHALKRLAGLYTRGAKKYGPNNWAKGLPYSNIIGSLERHLHQWKQGDDTEDHISAIAWAALAILHFDEIGRGKELDDIWTSKQ